MDASLDLKTATHSRSYKGLKVPLQLKLRELHPYQRHILHKLLLLMFPRHSVAPIYRMKAREMIIWNFPLRKCAMRSDVASRILVQRQCHMIDGSTNGWNMRGRNPFNYLFQKSRLLHPDLMWRCQIQKWEIVSIILPFSIRITRVVESKCPQFGWKCNLV